MRTRFVLAVAVGILTVLPAACERRREASRSTEPRAAPAERRTDARAEKVPQEPVPGSEAQRPRPHGPDTPGRGEGTQEKATLKIWVDEPFYQESTQPEITLIGVLQSAPVRLGPNTRDMPLKLVAGDETLNVYVTEREEKMLAPLVGRKVRVTGKRIDQRAQGFDVEIWIGTVTLLDG
jgi:hypothetical protein